MNSRGSFIVSVFSFLSQVGVAQVDDAQRSACLYKLDFGTAIS